MTEPAINWRLKMRLDRIRDRVANGKAPDFRTAARDHSRRMYARPAIWNPPYTDDKGRVWRWLERVDGSGLRVAVENATREANRNTIGYYVESFCDESQHGVVLATRDPESPRALFFPAVSDPHNDGAYHILWESESDLRSAINQADSLAESDAESQREYSEALNAGARWTELGEEIAAARKAALEILRDRKGATGSAALCAVIREKVESLLSEIREARAKREALADGEGIGTRYETHFSFWTGDKRLRAAFNEGAGSEVLA